MVLNSTIALLILSSHTSTVSNATGAYPQMVNNTFLIEIVSSIHRLYDFHNIVFYISKRLALHTDTAADFFNRFWDAFPTVPTVIMVNNSQTMDGFLSTPSLCIICTTERDDPVMEVAALALRGVRFFKTIFVLFPILETDGIYDSFEVHNIFYESIRQIYQWVWKKQFTNTALISIHNNVLVHDPYPTSSIINRTENWTASSFFVSNDGDFKGYVIDTPVRYDLPRVFYMPRHSNGIRHSSPVSGVSGKMFTAFVRSINATFNESLTDNRETEPVDINQIIKMIGEKQLEISVHSYTGMLAHNGGNSYPIEINDWCIMVPFRNRSPEERFLQESFREWTWYLMCFSVLYITVGIWLCSPLQRRDLSLSFLQAICSLLLIVPLSVLTLPKARIRFMFILLFVMGFFITNMYVSKMASFFTASPEQPQINTVQDVINANLHIMVMKYEYDLLESYKYPKGFMDLLIPTGKSDMDRHRDRFNTSYGYSIQSDRWNFLSIQQRYLNKPLFRLSQICLGPYYHVFPLQKDSHLYKPLQTFIMSASQVGLTKYWKNEAFADALSLGYVRMIITKETLRPLTNTFYRSIWLVWGFGMILSGLIFCLEVQGVMWQRMKNVFGKYWARLSKDNYED